MRVEKQIYQPKELIHIPASSIMHRKYQAYLSSEIKDLDLLITEIPFLFHIIHEGRGGVLQDDLIKITGITKSVATRTLQSLEAKDYITRVASEHSQRHKLILPTKKVFVVEKKLSLIFSKWHEKLTRSMSEADKKELNRLIIIMGENARELPF